MNIDDIKRIINEEIINEVLDRQLETKFSETSKLINGYETTIYNFKTNSGVEYSLLFMFDELTEPDIFNNIKNNFDDVILVHVAFTLSNRFNGDDDFTNFSDNTNNHETIELLGRISYLCNVFINKHPEIFVYVIGNEFEKNKLSLYNKQFENIFSNKFKKIEIYMDEYNSNAMFFIRKNMLK